MKRKIIDLIKSNAILYGIAKKVYRLLNINDINKLAIKNELLSHDIYYISYFMDREEEFEKIKNHYNEIQLHNKQLLIIITGTKFDLSIHNLFEDHPNISFLSIEYVLKYNRGLVPNNLILLDFNKNDKNYDRLLQMINRRL